MSTTSDLLTFTTARTTGLAQGLLKDVDASTAASFPQQDGKAINCNHPVFAYGHLAIYPQKMMKLLGAEPGEAAVPEGYSKLFEAGVECVDDPDSSIYPLLDEVIEHFNRAHQVVIEHLKTVDDSVLTEPVEDERMREAFGTKGSMVSFLLHDHYMFHLGQVSTWRRFMGLPSAF
jgi:hypothetical protein